MSGKPRMARLPSSKVLPVFIFIFFETKLSSGPFTFPSKKNNLFQFFKSGEKKARSSLLSVPSLKFASKETLCKKLLKSS